MGCEKHLIPRSYVSNLKTAVKGEGIYLYDKDGREFIDGCCGALLSNIGHGCKEIADAIYQQLLTMEFAHPSRWNTEAAEEAASELASITQEGLNHVWFGSGGSEAIEAALKIARQYYLERDGVGSAKSVYIARWNSYHGSTLGTMGLAGNMGRRRSFSPVFRECPKIEPHYCYRCPFGQEYPSCNLMCATQLESEIRRIGKQYVAAFVAEPIVGSSIGACVAPPGYWDTVRDICSRNDVLLIADEIMTGMGRTGKPFCLEHWGVIPDIVCSAKALTGGYAPVGAMVASDKIIDTILKGSGVFGHGHTYNANPVTAVAVTATIRYMKKNNVFGNCAEMGGLLEKRLEHLKDNPFIGEIRGMGLMWGLEIVQDKESKKPFHPSVKSAGVISKACFDEGLVIYPGTGQIDGVEGDQFLLAPPLTVNAAQIDEIAAKLEKGLAKATEQLLEKRGE